MKQSLASVLFLFLFACNAQEREARPAKKTTVQVNSSNSETNRSLTLSWQAQADLSAYHIFYVVGSKGREIDSLLATQADFASPKLKIDNTNMDSWPAKGSKACFYVEADLNGVRSDPSDQACITIP